MEERDYDRAGEDIRRASEMLHDVMENAVKCADLKNMDVPAKVRLTKPKRDQAKVVAKRKAARAARKKSK